MCFLLNSTLRDVRCTVPRTVLTAHDICAVGTSRRSTRSDDANIAVIGFNRDDQPPGFAASTAESRHTGKTDTCDFDLSENRYAAAAYCNVPVC